MSFRNTPLSVSFLHTVNTFMRRENHITRYNYCVVHQKRTVLGVFIYKTIGLDVTRISRFASASQSNERFSHGSLPLFDDTTTSLFVLRSVEQSREGEKEEYSVNHYPGVCQEGEGSLL